MNKKLTSRLNLTLVLALFVFFVMIANFLILLLIIFSLNIFRIHSTYKIIQICEIILCIILGTTLASFFNKRIVEPLQKVIDSIHRVANGEFDVKVNVKGIKELNELSHSFNVMTDELKSLEILRADFINNFSHEFKTPISSIRGFAKLLKDADLTDDEKQEYLSIIISESERLAQLSTNVLNLTKYETTQIITDKISFRLDEQIRRAVVITEPKWSVKNISMSIELEEVVFIGNEDLTQQIWLNLLDNAIKFSNDRGLIRIRLFKWNGKIRFTIQDNGLGMDKHTKDHAFDKFYQGDLSHGNAGNGLGLSLVRRIVELCNGTIEIESQIKEGSSFIITL